MKASSVYVVLGILSVSYFSAITKPGEDEHKNRKKNLVSTKICFASQIFTRNWLLKFDVTH
jgi:hypothetical protein